MPFTWLSRRITCRPQGGRCCTRIFKSTPTGYLQIIKDFFWKDAAGIFNKTAHSFFEVMLGDMATFVAPETTAGLARKYWP